MSNGFPQWPPVPKKYWRKKLNQFLPSWALPNLTGLQLDTIGDLLKTIPQDIARHRKMTERVFHLILEKLAMLVSPTVPQVDIDACLPGHVVRSEQTHRNRNRMPCSCGPLPIRQAVVNHLTQVLQRLLPDEGLRAEIVQKIAGQIDCSHQCILRTASGSIDLEILWSLDGQTLHLGMLLKPIRKTGASLPSEVSFSHIQEDEFARQWIPRLLPQIRAIRARGVPLKTLFSVIQADIDLPPDPTWPAT